ncbi:MAG: pyrrolysine--tRNA(Pyl) ligase large subunit [Deltaproteobacteria bacterium]|nr:pyrrolysine--tRNA(Pyl) ligase large subunit [Deltaproteobacteria bacterium]
MSITWTETQTRRLNELDAAATVLGKTFEKESLREQAYQQLEKKLVTQQRRRLKEFRKIHMRPALCRLESNLVDVLVNQGFAQVTTPIMMSKGLLKKMSIDDQHPLTSQIYWLDKSKCLRPMLAPHLYFVLVDLLRLWDKPVRIFEVGPCFRKESHGSQHSSEFTMLNLVEMGLPSESREGRIRELGSVIAEAAGIRDFRFEIVSSEIYENTIDVQAGKENIEIGSAAMGPHPLDRPWKINETWIGIGFGLERLLMAAENTRNLAKFGRSLAYLDGIRLNL